MKEKLQIAVRSLVSHTLRSGDLTPAFAGVTRTREAIRGHQKVQKSRPAGYESEVVISHSLETDTLILEIGGRIDGVYKGSAFSPEDRGEEAFVLIEEIKTTLGDPEEFEKGDNPLHWGQAKVYAYIYAAAAQLEKIHVQLTYYQLDTGRRVQIRRIFAVQALSDFFHALVENYLAWAKQLVSFRGFRDQSVSALGFPFSGFRPGQREMAVEVFRAIQQRRQLLVQAPTGIGKTMAVLFPAVKALEKNLTDKIFYLTARTTARAVAENALAFLGGQGLKLKSLTLTAKEKICFTPESACDPEACQYARGYYDRVRDAIASIFTGHDRWTRETIEEAARIHQVCPFEFSLELTQFSDVIICDYNYAFDPRVYLRRFFSEDTGGNYAFLVDEAHNLVDRSREMFSAQLLKQQFLDLRRRIKTALPGVYKTLGKINSAFVALRKRCESAGQAVADPEAPWEMASLLTHFQAQVQRWLIKNISTDFREDLLALYFEVGAFLNILEGYDDRYMTCAQAVDKEVRLKLFCMNPAGGMRAALSRCQSAVFFSATLSPLNYFKRLFGCADDARDLSLPSPFPRENFCVLMAAAVSTRYRKRTESLGTVVALIGALISATPGNQLIFFPSYEYLHQVHKAFSDTCPEVDLIIQAPGMSESDRDAFLELFTQHNSRPLVAFAVMGGIFGEGIDLAGKRLSGAAIAGVGLPGISMENDLIRDYFNRWDGCGFEYAYLYPGLNRVLQAAGRVIRSETDRGVVLLMDERYATARYLSLLPSHWHPIRVKSRHDVSGILSSFWQRTAE